MHLLPISEHLVSKGTVRVSVAVSAVQYGAGGAVGTAHVNT